MNWDDGWDGEGVPWAPKLNAPQGFQQPQQHIINPPAPQLRNNPYLRNQNARGYQQPQQQWFPPPQQQRYPQPVNMQPPLMQNPYRGGVPFQQNMGIPGMYNAGIGQMQGVDRHFRPGLATNASPVVTPVRQGRSFEAKHAEIQNLPSFFGRPTEEPYQHLIEFERACQITRGQGFSPDEVKLILFHFTLKDRAKEWFSALPPASIYTWADMQQQFLNEFYTMKKTTEARDAIRRFKQHMGEPFHEAFTRFKGMLRKCPHHGIEL